MPTPDESSAGTPESVTCLRSAEIADTTPSTRTGVMGTVIAPAGCATTSEGGVMVEVYPGADGVQSRTAG